MRTQTWSFLAAGLLTAALAASEAKAFEVVIQDGDAVHHWIFDTSRPNHVGPSNDPAPCSDGLASSYKLWGYQWNTAQGQVPVYLDTLSLDALGGGGSAAVTAAVASCNAESHPAGGLFAFSATANTPNRGVDVNTGFSDGPLGTLGITHIYSSTRAGKYKYMKSVDVQFDPTETWYDPAAIVCTASTPGPDYQFDLQSVAAHEFMHVMGLNHVTDVWQTVYTYASDELSYGRTLGNGDKAGIKKIYP